MTTRFLMTLSACILAWTAPAVLAEDAMTYELRTYTAAEGKLTGLHARFRNHTMALFEKHGITNVGYWTPTDLPNTLIYLIGHKDASAVADTWQRFVDDPAWQTVYADSIEDGPLVTHIESQLLAPTDYSPLESGGGDLPGKHLYELRTYTTNTGKLDNLHARFRDHTMTIFDKHGMQNVVYTVPLDENLADTTLVYVIAHPSEAAANTSWGNFIRDPEWQEVARASQVDGPILVEGGIQKHYLQPTDYSPLQ
ncbi:MAG: NIPSNAP family protein [Gammaproteobacteria bacterium]|nr:NIPSNAP family protein [Gammaproteobacteria bacterium]